MDQHPYDEYSRTQKDLPPLEPSGQTPPQQQNPYQQPYNQNAQQNPYGQNPNPYQNNPYGNPAPFQPNPYQPPYQLQPNTSGKGLSIASLVLGIASVVLCCTNFLAAVIAILGIIFGAIGMKNDSTYKNTAVAGLIVSIIGLLFSGFMILVYLIDGSMNYL